VKKGAFASVAGRFGEVTRDPDKDSEVKLRWLDDGKESSWTKVYKLSSVVASSSDLVRGSRIPVNDPEVTELSYQGQLIGPAEVILIAAATSTLAAVYEVNISMNDIGVDGAEALAAVIQGSALRCNIAGKFCGVREGATTGVAVKEGAFASVASRFGQVTSIYSDGDVKLTWLDDGEESDWTEPGKLSTVVASSSDLVFGSRIPVNDPEVTELSYQGQQIGPAEVTLIAAATSTLAALTEIDVRQNPGIDEASLAALRAAAKETGCTILADEDDD
jgi:hypothetical protein